MSDYRKIVNLLEANTGAKRMSQVFEDFVEMAALALRNAVDYCGRDEREAQYLRTASRYERAELDRFAQSLSLVTVEMERDPCDVLGRLYVTPPRSEGAGLLAMPVGLRDGPARPVGR
ncbi:hypothetical protein ACFWNT_29680 [Streptomyces sp. NPDC058409]|uniref:hypothetical protein n=1 Tax=Streptomyces sp. NPDC058409 TaxID=3346484 RepID=UPI00366786E0